MKNENRSLRKTVNDAGINAKIINFPKSSRVILESEELVDSIVNKLNDQGFQATKSCFDRSCVYVFYE